MEIGFDVINDLCLNPEESFNWEGKATSLYCIVAGNISNDLRTVAQTLIHLSQFYQGIFYCPGCLEYENTIDYESRTEQIVELCSKIPNVACLHHHVVIVDGIAILGCNGWHLTVSAKEEDIRQTLKYEDIAYLKKAIDRLQRHLDVKKIILVTNEVPKKELYFGEIPPFVTEYMNLDYCLIGDTEKKVKHWVFGTYKKTVDTYIGDINYISNSKLNSSPYWAKRLTASTK